MARSTGLGCGLALSLLLGGCGYGPAKEILFGGISSSGNKPREEEPQSNGGSQDKPEAQPMPSAPLNCAEPKMLLAGATFEPQVAPSGEACRTGEIDHGDVACVTALGFVSDKLAVVTFADGTTAKSGYRQCGDMVAVALATVPGLTVTHDFRMADDGQTLLHVASERSFGRRATP